MRAPTRAPAEATGRRLKEAEARAVRAERRLREVLDAMPEGVVLLDSEGRYVLWNQRYAEIYHRSADLFAPGLRMMDVLRLGVERGDYPEALGCEETWLQERALRLAEPGERHEQRLSDGRWLMIEERPLSDGGSVGLRVDITEMKKQALALEAALADARSANRAKSEFLANVSHEIRTPLNGVLGMAEVLLRDPLEPLQRERLEVIVRSGRMLLSLLNDVLDLSKIEAGKLSISETAFHLGELIEMACAPFASIASEKGIELRLEGGPGDHPWRRGDPLRVAQVISNLVSNAMKFTERGAVRIFVSHTPEALEITVQDEGPGIPADRIGEVFQQFAQIESTATRRFAGTGLGLAIADQLVEMMRGKIVVSSAVGRGSAFTVCLPLPVCEAPGSEAPQRAEVAIAGARILAAEDNSTNQAILAALLEPFGVELTLVADGAAAVSAAAAGEFDAILMDIQMPVLDGVDACRGIRAAELQEGRRRTPIIALSANIMSHQIAAYRAAGMDEVCGKPIDLPELMTCLARTLATAHAERRPQMRAPS